jgi:NAD(P)-dependent dehydrogenase (short-subunit alcohol dehydrogenase family)
MKTLKGASVIVTGASGGIGRATVEAFLAEGSRVIMGVNRDEGCKDLQEKWTPERARMVRADLSQENDIRNLVDTAVQAFGGLDVLVNNGACLFPMKAMHEHTHEEFDRVLAVNVRGLWLTCKFAYLHLKKSKGNIVSVSSMAGVAGEMSHSIYSASKGFMNSLTKSMAIDYGREGIRCNAVALSSALVPNIDAMIAAQPNAAEIMQLRKDINLLGYTSQPEETANVIVFLASPRLPSLPEPSFRSRVERKSGTESSFTNIDEPTNLAERPWPQYCPYGLPEWRVQ